MGTTIASCPGKVLTAGGYLVLDRSYEGFVISTPSRFYTVIREIGAAAGTQPGSENGQRQFKILVKSPQFQDGRWEYEATKESNESEWNVQFVNKEGSSANSFVHLSIISALLLSSATSPHSRPYADLDVTIVGSNDFYSQSRSNDEPVPFARLDTTLAGVHKTGLGSSAAMVTSLCAGLYLHLTSDSNTTPAPKSRPDHSTLEMIHNLAQYVHSLAQGKVGSGFDVSAAVWGSQVYRRFSEICLAALLATKSDVQVCAQLLYRTLSPKSNPLWTDSATSAVVTPFALPPRTMLILADVDAGSNTPSMVGKVLAWKKRDAIAAEKVWEALRSANSKLADAFAELSRSAKENVDEYDAEVTDLSSRVSDQWSTASTFSLARSHILQTRQYMRSIGTASEVPIEPIEQTELLDACCALPGVIGAGVPGAGGYDAIWVLVLAPPSSSIDPPHIAVTRMLRDWNAMSVRPLSRNAWVQGGKETSEEGLLLIEKVDDVEGLAAVLTS